MPKKKALKEEENGDGYLQPGPSKELPEIFNEVTQQKKENDELRLKLKHAYDSLDRTVDSTGWKGKAAWCGQQMISKKALVLIGVLTLFTLIVLLIFIAYQWNLADTNSKELSALQNPQSLVQGLPVNHDSLKKFYLNLVDTKDNELEECQGPELKRSFPDVDYALLGYNILRGYPLAVGHDPGFTYPIFRTDYSQGKQTADCRFSIPDGLVAIPDVSCVTSFESKEVRTKYEFSKSLEVSASVEGGGWGVYFSASTDYKESSSTVTSGEYVYILSTAKCNYYFSKLIQTEPPKFDDAFLIWIHRLDQTNAVKTYINFFELFGTHFPMKLTFGSRFTYEYKMKTSSYESQREKGVNVKMAASYNGWFAASGSGSLAVDATQKQQASEFAKLVTTKTITVGAPPPADGDAQAWASTVKESPVPSSYTLVSIEELFTSDFMKDINVNYQKIYDNIVKYKFEYCKYLMDKGDVDTCETLSPGIILQTTKLDPHYQSVAATFAECIEQCLDQIWCVAITFCKECPRSNSAHNTCFMFRNSSASVRAFTSADWESIVFDSKLENELKISGVSIVGVERGFENQTDSGSSLDQCRQLCKEDVHCIAYTYCICPEKLTKCHLYSDRSINRLKEEPGTDTFFLSSRR